MFPGLGEKVLGVRTAWHRGHSLEHSRLIRALAQASAWFQDPENRAEAVEIIASKHYVNTPKTVIDDPQFLDRFTWTTMEETGIEQLLFPLNIDGEEPPVPTTAPTVGQHSAEVLRRVLGYDDAKIAALRATGATN